MAKITDLFDKDDMETAEKFLDYYDGDQKEYVLKILKSTRANSLQAGLMPRHRNIVKMVVDKSGLLFNGKAPVLSVYDSPEAVDPDPVQTQELMTWMDGCDWIEFFTNFDAVVRMLRTSVILWQYVPAAEGDPSKLFPIILGQHNCAIHVDNITRKMDTLLYSTGEDETAEYYRVYTPELIQDISVNKITGDEVITHAEPNPYLMIPASVFHDTNIPREGFWNEIPEDLIEINDIYNIALSDSEYSSIWSKYQTAITNATVASTDGGNFMIPVQDPTRPIGVRLSPVNPAAIGGPGKIIELDTSGLGGQAATFEYKGPTPDLMPLDSIVKQWVMDFAADWSVNASVESNAADSGFKLIVKEMPNLELRKKRQKMFEAGFKRMYQVIKTIVNQWNPGTFSEESVLFCKFAPPDLPLDEKLTEEVWSRRIKEGRASRTMYFMQVHGMTEDEAKRTIVEIDAEAAAYNPAPVTPVVTATPGMVSTKVTV